MKKIYIYLTKLTQKESVLGLMNPMLLSNPEIENYQTDAYSDTKNDSNLISYLLSKFCH